jgi:hypothetical protein
VAASYDSVEALVPAPRSLGALHYEAHPPLSPPQRIEELTSEWSLRLRVVWRDVGDAVPVHLPTPSER